MWPWRILNQILCNQEKIMAGVDDLAKDVVDLKTAVAAGVANTAKLFADYKAAVANAADPAVLAQLDADMQAQIKALNDATAAAPAP